MIAAIIWFLFFCVLYFLRMYCSDCPCFPGGKYDNLTMPSVKDLDSSSSILTIDEYVQKEIIPAAAYFEYDREFTPDPDSVPEAYLLILLEFIPCVFSFKGLYSFLRDMVLGAHLTLAAGAIAIITIVFACLTARWLLKKLYRYITIPEFPSSKADMADFFGDPLPCYPISQSRYFQNYVITTYLHYYQRIAKSLRRRRFLQSVINVGAIVVYLLFFFRAP